MTWRESIQELTRSADAVYCKAGALRDTANQLEKEYFNKVRSLMHDVDAILRELDEKLTDARAKMIID
jgi:hypothetical protein